MSSPYEHQPLAPPDPWHAQRSVPPDLPRTDPSYRELPPPQAQWQPSQPVSKQGNGLAITALVVAIFALLVSSVAGVFVLVVGGTSGSAGDLEGTAPQVVAGQEYPGKLLENEITRVISNDGGDVTSVSCPATPAVVADAVTVCHGVVDGFKWSYKVTFQDGKGHFAVAENEE
jgi:hypothetical protein